MEQYQKGFDVLDALAIISFLIGIRNYEENVDQTTVQNAVQTAVDLINEHLESQDAKIEKIIEMLGGVKNE